MFSQLKAVGELAQLAWMRNIAATTAAISAIVAVVSGIVTLITHVMLQSRIAEIKSQLPH